MHAGSCKVLVLVRFRETASQVYTLGFRVPRERERERIHSLAHTGTSLYNFVVGSKEVSKGKH
jgi:hypothetical protein